MNELLVSSKVPPRGGVNQHPTVRLYEKQPFRTLLFFGLIFETLTLQLPVRTLALVLFPQWSKPVPQWPWRRALLVGALRHYAGWCAVIGIRPGVLSKTTLPRLTAKDDATAIWVQPVHRQQGLTGAMKTLFDAGDCTTTRVPAFWYGDKHADLEQSRDAEADERVVLFLHGGGYAQRSAAPSSATTRNLHLVLEAAKRSSKPHAPRRALALEYRLTGDGATFPAIFADALAAWTYLVRELHFKPQNIILLGDSAGGNLVLALARYLRDERPLWKELGLAPDDAVADGLILVSPWVDVSGSIAFAGPSSSGYRNSSSDYLTEEMLRAARAGILAGLPATSLHSPYISAVTTERMLEGDLFDSFPRTLCLYGGKEIFLDEIRAFGQQFSASTDAGRAGPLTMHEEPLAVHDYPVLPIGFAEEYQRACDLVAEWL